MSEDRLEFGDHGESEPDFEQYRSEAWGADPEDHEEQRDTLAEQLAERVRRHESDAHDLGQLRVTVRDAEVLVDTLADALLDAIRDYYDPEVSLESIVHIIDAKPCIPDWQTAAVAALRGTGRLLADAASPSGGHAYDGVWDGDEVDEEGGEG